MNYALRYPRFWLAYFVLSAAMVVVGTFYDAFANFGSVDASSIVATSLAILGLLPLYGYVTQTRYAPQWLWKTLFIFYVLVTLVAVLMCLFVAVSRLELDPILAFNPIIAIGFLLFYYFYLFALHQYVYRSPHLWAKT